MWRTTPLHRSEETGTTADLPQPAPYDTGSADGRQGIAAGSGPLLHRNYLVRIREARLSPPALLNLVADNLDRASPEVAAFRKTRGQRSGLDLGDELVVRMPGP